MEKPDKDGWEYILTIPYKTDEDLDRIIYDDILGEAHSIADLRNGFIEADVVSLDDKLIVSNGQQVTPSLRQRLENFARNTTIREPLYVLVDADVNQRSVNQEPGAAASKPAKVVFPHPGGPHKTSDGSSSASASARSGPPGRTRRS